jgi:hypothetical protein
LPRRRSRVQIPSSALFVRAGALSPTNQSDEDWFFISPHFSRKTPPQIAKDITRRLLPEYYQDLQYVEQRHAEHLERMKQVANAALHFGAILQVAPPEVSEEERVRFHLGYVGSIWGDVQVDEHSVDIKLDDVPFEIAAMMLVPIGEYIRAHPKERDA